MIEKRYQARFSISLRHRGCEDGTLEGLVKQFRQRYVPADGSVVDIGGGYCEFINAVRCRKKYTIDLVLSSPSRASVLARAFQRSLLRCLWGDFRALRWRQPVHPLIVDSPAFRPQQCLHLAMPIVGVLFGGHDYPL
jgi:hypothetical protein